ncbi:ankyrin repeat domain-containing protein [Peribacillus deserti]|uniref:Uncharacterized protein n=1 Tax=Peribacillus deserti TaxID=673318 RepID=A0A2N5M726_9BACI|nr:ankyrin repeat domain-containing protein [Peribacillus deserti]PLT30160.1 hypothetical protein CUU66_08955 [Peribacillus deserti]
MKKKLIIASVLLVMVLLSVGIFLNQMKPTLATKDSVTKQELIESIITGNLKKVREAAKDLDTVNFVTKEEAKTPLEYAFQYQQYDIAVYLIKKQGKINAKSQVPIVVQAALSLPDYLQTVKQTKDQRNKRIRMIEAVLKNFPEAINLTDIEGNNALHIASGKGDPDVIRMLEEAGIDDDMANNLGNTPVELAALSNQPLAVEAIAAKNPERFTKLNSEKKSLIILAASNSVHDMLKFLLKINRDHINDQDIHGHTALMYASEYGDTEAVKILLKHGAAAGLRSKEGKTAADYARQWKHKDIVDLLS